MFCNIGVRDEMPLENESIWDRDKSLSDNRPRMYIHRAVVKVLNVKRAWHSLHMHEAPDLTFTVLPGVTWKVYRYLKAMSVTPIIFTSLKLKLTELKFIILRNFEGKKHNLIFFKYF